METISRSLLTFLLNSLWQVSVAAAVAAVACRMMRNGPASHRHAIWVAALAVSLLLPVASVRRATPVENAQYPASLADVPAAPAQRGPAQTTAAARATPADPVRSISLAETTAATILVIYALLILLRLARVGRAALATARIRGSAKLAAIPDRFESTWMRCRDAFQLEGVKVMCSPRVSGPVTAGRAIVIPDGLLDSATEDVMATALGHEMAHIARRDFACNVLYELALVPIGFHPAAWMIRRELERTREMACDELVTRRLLNPDTYARSIMSIAGAMMAVPGPGYTLGVFDGDILEERIRRLVAPVASSGRHARVVLATGLSALAAFVVIASGLSISAQAQSPVDALLKQSAAAYKQQDFRTAAQLAQNAVAIDPGNVKAKLHLGQALLAQYTPGSDPTNPVLQAARQQFLDVIGRDPHNVPALDGYVGTLVMAKQWSEAREWTLKALSNGPNANAYYTIGFLDWSITYPDYAAARLAAGMKPQDPGIIPDANARLQLRVQHGSQISEGMQNLQSALQLDPDYSDAMAYMNLLYRIQAGIADTNAEYTNLIAQADSWVEKALDARQRQAQGPHPADGYMLTAPPPPPPPPPPPAAAAIPEGAIRAEGAAMQAKLVNQTPPNYPPQARAAGITGTVRLSVLIAKDGTVEQINPISGPPMLVGAAVEAVRHWTYQPTLLNGAPVEVATAVNVTFGN